MVGRYDRTQIAHPAMPTLAATMSRFDKNTLAGFVEVMFAILDCSDADPDVKLNGDETEHHHSEDCFAKHPLIIANVGCPVGDPSGCGTRRSRIAMGAISPHHIRPVAIDRQITIRPHGNGRFRVGVEPRLDRKPTPAIYGNRTAAEARVAGLHMACDCPVTDFTKG